MGSVPVCTPKRPFSRSSGPKRSRPKCSLGSPFCPETCTGPHSMETMCGDSCAPAWGSIMIMMMLLLLMMMMVFNYINRQRATSTDASPADNKLTKRFKFQSGRQGKPRIRSPEIVRDRRRQSLRRSSGVLQDRRRSPAPTAKFHRHIFTRHNH